MSFTNKRLIKILAAVAGMFAMTMIASRQLYLFSVFRDASGMLDRQHITYGWPSVRRSSHVSPEA